MDSFYDFYKGKRVFITGHTGFKGSWLSIWLLELGAELVGVGLDPYTEKDNFNLCKLADKMVDIRGDIRDKDLLISLFKKHQPEVVFHLAAQPLVRESYEKPIETYEVNVMGTINVLEAIRVTDSVKVGVMITTDKCYENREQIWGYREDDAMGGYDPYSSSKGAAEIAISSWRRSFFNPGKISEHGKSIASARAGNVIGGGDWAKDRIIPDCIRAIEAEVPIKIRNPNAVRPWQHVLEPLSGYLLLGMKMWKEPAKYCQAWNFGPSAESVSTVWEVAHLLVEKYGKGCVEDVSQVGDLHEAGLLMLDITKARALLGWRPHIDVSGEIQLIVDWYRRYREPGIYEMCVKQIRDHYGCFM